MTASPDLPQAAPASAPGHLDGRRDVLGHPRGLFVLFLTETWALFSYFGMQAMLVYYMTKQLHFSQPKASALFGAYAAFAYLTPLLGGYIADRWLGQRRAVIVGSLTMAVGHFLMAFEPAFFPALALIGLGNGFFLPSTATQVGALYADGDGRRDRAFSIYYMGINLGGVLAPLACGTIGELYGWHYGFALAGFGMLIGLAIYVGGRDMLPPERRRATRDGGGVRLDGESRRAVWSLILIAALVVLFRVAYEQSGNTIALWADGRTDRTIRFGARAFTIPATWFQSINPLLILSLTPLITFLWTRQARRGREASALSKMSLGCAIAALGFVLMLGAAWQVETQGEASWLWLVGFFVLLTVGELFVLPIGLSVFSQLAPPAVASMMIGVWYLSKFAGSLLAGWLGAYFEVLSPVQFFSAGAGFAFAAAIALALARQRLTKLNPRLARASSTGFST
jgi:POT family proton-dependent oligopeptide transporter